MTTCPSCNTFETVVQTADTKHLYDHMTICRSCIPSATIVQTADTKHLGSHMTTCSSISTPETAIWTADTKHRGHMTTCPSCITPEAVVGLGTIGQLSAMGYVIANKQVLTAMEVLCRLTMPCSLVHMAKSHKHSTKTQSGAGCHACKMRTWTEAMTALTKQEFRLDSQQHSGVGQ